MPLINFKIELKLKHTSHCVMSTTGHNRNDTNSHSNFFYYQRQKIICLCSQFISQKITKKYQNFLAKDLKDQAIGIDIRQKVRIKTRQMSTDVFSNQILKELTDCLY